MNETDEMLDVIAGLLSIICTRVSYPIGEDHANEDQIVISGWEILNRHGRLCDLAGDGTDEGIAE